MFVVSDLSGICGPNEKFVRTETSYFCECLPIVNLSDDMIESSLILMFKTSSSDKLIDLLEAKQSATHPNVAVESMVDDIFTADQIRLSLFDEHLKHAMGITFQGTFDYWSWFSRETLNTVYVWDLDPIDHFDSFKFHRETNGRGFDITVNQDDDDDCMSTIFLRIVCPGHAAFSCPELG